uniref:Uncharacterized protein n=1 Tax=viral metagenome TaxID=1070528 RepID=A0A6C0KK56_9ZZZZ
MKIGCLIPSTSKGREEWKTYRDTYLFKNTLKTFLITYDQEHEYIFYVGIDRNDRIYDNPKDKKEFERIATVMKNISIRFIYMDNITKGHLTVMWNRLYQIAYDENCEYFFQCGDDIEFHTKSWVNSCIGVLQQNDNIGLTGPINNNAKILTQSFVSRKHMEIFGYYFPEEIINWFCDDWYNDVYKKVGHFFPLKNHFCANIGGAPRYNVNNEIIISRQHLQEKHAQLRLECNKIVHRDYAKINLFIQNNNNMEELMKKYKLFWQYPVITEKTFYIQNKKNLSFVGFPWATIIDKRYNLNIIFKILSPRVSSTRLQYTCCQHISFRKLIPLFKALHITMVYSPHKIKGEDQIDGVVIKPCPLYAVNIEDPSRNTIFKTNDVFTHPRTLLYSFVGGYQSGYLTNIRNDIFKLQSRDDTCIQNTGDWHFNQLVYHPSQSNELKENVSDKHNEKTDMYNKTLLSSRYSLCPSGSGPNSIRFWESLAMGSIPILLSDTLELPENNLWKDTIITVSEKDLHLLNNILSKIDTQTENSMRKNCIELYKYYRENYNNYSNCKMTLFIEMSPSLIAPYYKVFGHFFLDHLFMLYKIKDYYQREKKICIDSIYIDETLLNTAPFIKPFYESIFKVYTKNKVSLNLLTIGSIIGSVSNSERSNIYLSKTDLKDDIPNYVLENGRKLSDFNRKMMELFTLKVKNHFIKNGTTLSNEKVLIIDRKKSPRRLLQINDMIDKLNDKGFHCTKVTFDDIDLSQQISLVSQFKTIICACGSVQVHISFLRDDCTFIELCESGFRYPNTSIYGNFNNINTYSLTSPLNKKYYEPKYKMSENANKLFQSVDTMPHIIMNDINSIEREKQFYSKLMSYNCFWIHTIQDINCNDHIDNILKLLNTR